MNLGNLYIVSGIAETGIVKDMKMKLIKESDKEFKFLVRDSMGFVPLVFKVHNVEKMEDTGDVR